MSNTFTIRKAEKAKAKLRIGLAGPSGSGKTYSALLLARGLAEWDKIVVIDTEQGSADLYSNLGQYNVLTLENHKPQDYIDAIEAAEDAGMEVIIVDSITHEWSAAKDMVDKLGGRFQDWAKVTPLHNRFINAILKSKAHMITTVRSKTDYSMDTDGGKTKVQKVGMKPETREGFEYEMTVTFDLNINHMVETSKDRTGIFMDADPFVISEETGKTLLTWANDGVDYVTKIEQLVEAKGVEVDPILKHYKVPSLDMLTTAQYKKVIGQLEAMDDKSDEKKSDDSPKKPESGDTKKEAPKDGDSKPEKKKMTLEEAKAKAAARGRGEDPDQEPEGTENPDEEIDVDEIDEGIEKMKADEAKAKDTKK